MTRATDHGFITEAEVIETWPMIPATDIRRARRKGDLPFYQFPSGPHYRRQDVETFIERKYRRGPPPARKGDASSQPEPATPLVAPHDAFKPARPVSPRPHRYETMAAEEARIQGEALARRRQDRASAIEEAASPAVPEELPPPQVDRPETREEEINRLRAEVYADRILSRRPAARKAAEAEKAAKARRKGNRVTTKPGRP